VQALRISLTKFTALLTLQRSRKMIKQMFMYDRVSEKTTTLPEKAKIEKQYPRSVIRTNGAKNYLSLCQ
jgi:hypothetical protein